MFYDPKNGWKNISVIPGFQPPEKKPETLQQKQLSSDQNPCDIPLYSLVNTHPYDGLL